MTSRILVGDCREMLKTLPDNSVHVACTSPPYFGLRSYSTNPQVWGGDPDHGHEWIGGIRKGQSGGTASAKVQIKGTDNFQITPDSHHATCSCGSWLGELGSEESPERYIANLVEVFREVRRVLRPDGTCWVNLGDSYAGSGKGPTGHNGIGDQAERQGFHSPPVAKSLPPKNLLLMPFRVALALQADGWWLRSAIVWAKKSPMPESVTDRPSSAYEMIFLLSKSAKYYFDQTALNQAVADYEAVRNVQWEYGNEALQRVQSNAAAGGILSTQGRQTTVGMQAVRTCPYHGVATNSERQGVESSDHEEVQRERSGQNEAQSGQSDGQSEGREGSLLPDASREGLSSTLPPDGETQSNPEAILRERKGQTDNGQVSGNAEGAGIPTPWSPQAPLGVGESEHLDRNGVGANQERLPGCLCLLPTDGQATDEGPRGAAFEGRAAREGEHRTGVPFVQRAQEQPSVSNSRNFWLLSPEPFPQAHFATFVTEIPRRAILAGTSQAGCCPACLAPWARVVERGALVSSDGRTGLCGVADQEGKGNSVSRTKDALETEHSYYAMARRERQSIGWAPTCRCAPTEPIPCTVLDPFSGSGTTGLVASRLGRDYIGIELNLEYARMSEARINSDELLFSERVQVEAASEFVPLDLFAEADGRKEHMSDRPDIDWPLEHALEDATTDWPDRLGGLADALRAPVMSDEASA